MTATTAPVTVRFDRIPTIAELYRHIDIDPDDRRSRMTDSRGYPMVATTVRLHWQFLGERWAFFRADVEGRFLHAPRDTPAALHVLTELTLRRELGSGDPLPQWLTDLIAWAAPTETPAVAR